MLYQKIKNKKFSIGIIGLGYVGLPRAIQFCNKNIKVIALDKDITKVKKLKRGENYLSNISKNDIKKNIKNKNLIPTNDFSKIKLVDVIILCLPTPLKKNLTPDLTSIKDTFNSVKNFLKENQLLCLESTSYPGTTREIFFNYLKKEFFLGKNFFLGYSPERNDPGQINIKSSNIPKLISGYTNNCLKTVDAVYSLIFKTTVKMSSIELAEMTKIYENVFRAINIGFVNEMKKICTKMKIDVDEVISAAKTKPFGFSVFYPGPGLGGHCIPIDPFYLSWKAKKSNIKTEFINLAGKINNSIPYWVVQNLVKNLKNKSKIKKKYKILVLGVSYKKNINDTRESPGLKIIQILKKKNFFVNYSDPYVPFIPELRNYKFKNMKSIKISSKNLTKYDACILVTDHDKFNYKLIQKYSKLIIDTRQRLNKKKTNVVYA